MAATTTQDRDFDVQVLDETVQGVFEGKNAFMGSILASQGAVIVRGDMMGDANWIGNEITIPYWGTIGEFEPNPEDQASVPKTLKQTHEKATVARDSLSFEVTRWARNSGTEDPYVEASRQILLAATRAMDRHILEVAATTPLVKDVYSSGTPVTLDWDTIVDARALWGDSQNDIVAMVLHSKTEADLRKLKDDNDRPLLLDSMMNAEIPRFCGIPIIVSDRVTLDGSSMAVLTKSDPGIPDVTITGTPTGPWDLKILVTATGGLGVGKFKFSTDGGNTYSGEITTAASVDLIDPNTDSLIGYNGTTGLTLTMESDTYTEDDYYTSKASLKVSTYLVQRGALAFWYNRQALGIQTDKDILKDNDVAAIHLYYAAHRYRRRRGGSRAGVVAVRHNVSGF